jgi:phenylacetate-CoA ligase
MRESLHRNLILRPFEAIVKGRRTFAHWRELEASQWLDSERLARLQLDRLRDILRLARECCPYYRERWRALGLRPDALRGMRDFSAWPVIDREIVREHRMAMRNERITAASLITKATGGSSGTPLVFDLDAESHERRTAAAYRGYGWARAGPGTRQLALWGTPIGARSVTAALKDRLYWTIQGRHIVSCFDGERDLAGKFLAELDRRRPDAIVAYVNPLDEVARELERRGTPPRWAPQAIVVGAERLHDFQRERIERVFRAPVHETYGSREFMLIGAECERHEGLHVTMEQLVVEVLDDDGTPTPRGLEGNIVVTDLFNRGMPLIRYATGDRAIAGYASCSCGRGLPLLSCVTGRRLDMLVASDGRVIPGEFFPHLVKDFPAVRRFQVIQEERDRVRFRLAAPELGDADRARLEGLVRGALGRGMRIDFESVDAPEAIAQTPAGKLQVVINRAQTRRAA